MFENFINWGRKGILILVDYDPKVSCRGCLGISFFHFYSDCLETWIYQFINNLSILYFIAPAVVEEAKVEEVVEKVEELKVEGMWFFSSTYL